MSFFNLSILMGFTEGLFIYYTIYHIYRFIELLLFFFKVVKIIFFCPFTVFSDSCSNKNINPKASL